MKKFFGIVAVLLFLGISAQVNAQEKDSKVEKEMKQAGKEVKKGAKKAGNKTAEVASKGKSKVVDKTYKDKVGPNGETIYIDKYSKYYWVDKKGHKQYVEEAELKNK